ncbi:MAG: hypothetical protein O7D30_11395, partial [Rickettsia endosymbiont of Ixodes persulcatus]|nr:hypothetical protein [Rickettsia endosymbiont of Ixodes persulcatus]
MFALFVCGGSGRRELISAREIFTQQLEDIFHGQRKRFSTNMNAAKGGITCVNKLLCRTQLYIVRKRKKKYIDR